MNEKDAEARTKFINSPLFLLLPSSNLLTYSEIVYCATREKKNILLV